MIKITKRLALLSVLLIPWLVTPRVSDSWAICAAAYDVIESRQNELPADKSAKIVVYGLTGPMGYAAAQKLSELGFTRVIHFNGGMQAWADQGHRLLHRGK